MPHWHSNGDHPLLTETWDHPQAMFDMSKPKAQREAEAKSKAQKLAGKIAPVPRGTTVEEELDRLRNSRRTEAVARHSDPETSHWAAEKLGDLTDNQAEVAELFRRWGPMIDEEMVLRAKAAGTRQTDSGLRTRRSECVEVGILEWTGDMGFTANGNKSRIHAYAADRLTASASTSEFAPRDFG